MALTQEKVRLMKNERYPLSSHYDSDWIVDNSMGSHSLWLTEALVSDMELKPGMKVLDMGCGKAISSIFLAKEFGVKVWANDLWISADDNWRRICEAGVQDSVFPIRAEAHSLPYAGEFFDAIISINSLQFYGTDQLYFKNYFAKLVRPGGQIGIIVPGIYQEFENGVPEYLQPYWDPEFYAWHSPEWWRNHWDCTGVAKIEIADTLPDREGYEIFRLFGEIIDADDQLFFADKGRNISYVRIIARKNYMNQLLPVYKTD